MAGDAPSGRWRRAGLLLGSLLLTALLVEGGARLALRFMGASSAPIQVGWQEGEGVAAPVRDLLYVPDAELFFRLTPDLDVPETANPRIFDLRTDSRGLRSAEVSLPKPPGTYRVLAVGDSCTFGSGAGQADTWPAQLERDLSRARGDLRFEVLNAGVPGFTSYQALRYLELEGFDLDPDAVAFTTAVNDASPATAGGKRRFGGGIMLSDREYAGALRSNRRLGITRLLWRAGLLGSGAAAPGAGKRRVSPDEYGRNLEAFAAESRRRGILPVIVAWPLRSQAAEPAADTEIERTLALYQRRAAQAARVEGAVFVDLVSGLRGRQALFIDAVHMGPEGYGVVAEQLAAAILARLAAPASGFRELFQEYARIPSRLEKSLTPSPAARPLPLYRQQHPLPRRSGPHSSRNVARSRFWKAPPA